MANKTIPDLTALGADAAADDLFEISDTSASAASKSVTTAQIVGSALAALRANSGTADATSATLNLAALSTTGTISAGTGASTAGAVVLTQGTTQSAGTTNITLQAPAAVTSYIRTLPGSVGSSGVVFETVSGTTQTESLIGVGSSGYVLTSNGPGFEPTFQAASGGGSYVPLSFSTSYGKNKRWYFFSSGGGTTPTLINLSTLNGQGSVATVAPTSTLPRHLQWSLTGSTGLYGVLANLNDFYSSWDFTLSWVVSLGDSIATMRAFIGVSNANPGNSDTPSNACGFRYSTNAGDTNWMYYDGTTATSTGVAVAQDTVYVMTLVKSGTGVTYYINGSSVGTATFNPAGQTLGYNWIANVLSGTSLHSIHCHEFTGFTTIQ